MLTIFLLRPIIAARSASQLTIGRADQDISAKYMPFLKSSKILL